MINIIPRLGFNDVFPDENKQDTLNYLQDISKDFILKLIGFCNTKQLPNFDNFFTNPIMQKEISSRVFNYGLINKIKIKPRVISTYTSLKLAEIILSNKKVLIENDIESNIDSNELNIFKCFLIENEKLNDLQIVKNLSDDNFERIVDFSIAFSFSTSDFPPFENDNLEFLKLIYVTNEKVNYLLQFLKSKPEFENFRNHFFNSFNVDSEDLFREQITYLFANLIRLKQTNHYVLVLDDEKYKPFIKSLMANIVIEDPDFTYLKNNPIYEINDKAFSIINYYFLIDKFYKSAKFKLKEIYQYEKDLVKIYGDFFNFFNKQFSEIFLMKQVLDKIFHKKYHIKKPDNDHELQHEPDYYVRHNNCIFLFETKNELVEKTIKSSFDIEQINNLLELKFLKNQHGEKVGLGQLIYSIKEIKNKNFSFDDYVNHKNNLTIFPILLIHDRIFQILGVNYRLDNWFQKEIQASDDIADISTIKHLTVLDIDTLIFYSSHFMENDSNLKNILKDHLSKMSEKKNVKGIDWEQIVERATKNLSIQLTPLSHRMHDIKFNMQLLINQFKGVIKD